MRSLILLAASAMLLAGCKSNDIANRKRPDEFAVGKQAPLVIPPDYALVPPKPGAPRPIANDSQQQALEALFGPGVKLPPNPRSKTIFCRMRRRTKPIPGYATPPTMQVAHRAPWWSTKGTSCANCWTRRPAPATPTSRG